MAYSADKKPGELTALTTLATDDVFVVGDTSDASEVAKYITKANLITDLTTSFAPALGADDNYVTDAEKAALHAAVTVADSAEIDLTLTGQQISASIIAGSIDETKLDTSVNASLDLADSALQVAAIGTTVQAYDADLTTWAGVTPGTGVATALAVNVGTAGAPVINGGALGTPSSGTLTNCTGLPLAGVVDSTTEALGVGTLEVGHATDTTISRASSGIIAVEGVNQVNVSTAQVLTNKDLTATSNSFTAASTTQSGVAEASIASEVNTGTDAARYVSPDSFAGSNFGIRYVQVTLNGTTALTTSEKAYFRIPAALTGMNLVSVAASVGTGAAGSSSSGTPTFTVKNVTDGNQMLSTSLTVDANEYTSATAATAAVIDTTKDDIISDDLIEVACTVAGTGVTYAVVTLGFQLP